MSRYWLYEIRLLLSILGAGLLGGWATAHGAAWLILAGIVYFGLQALRLRAFLRWLQRGRLAEPPALPGVWGELCYLVYRIHDRARKKQRRLGELLQRYQATAAALPDAAVVLGRDHSIQWLNEAASQLLALRPRRDVGQRIDNLLRHPAFVAYLHGGDYSEPLVLSSLVTEDSVLALHIVPYGQDQRLLVARDITRMHHLEVMRRDFVANVSHELRTPLSVILGYLESVREGETDAPRLRHAIDAMAQQAGRMSHLIDDLLTISRLETEAREHEGPVNVPLLIKGIVAEARPLCERKGQELSLDVDPALWLKGHEQYLHSAFLNLLSNAVRYTPEQGAIAVRWRRGEGGEAWFEVQDNGIGIPAAALPRLTERFFRVDAGRSREMGGTGLGLAIVKHVLKQHDARLEVASTPGKGSLFRCRFPAARVAGRDAGLAALS